jgi:hypothetical protein
VTGRTEKLRAQLSEALEQIPAAPKHGTYATYQQERKRGQTCTDCRKAAAEYAQQYRKRRPSSLDRDKLQAKRRSLALQELAKRHHREYLEILTEIKRVEVKVRRAA